jgi:alpha-beta hydrolase superfamily lysophospholipase
VDEQIRILREVVAAQKASGKVNVFGASWGGVIVAAFWAALNGILQEENL